MTPESELRVRPGGNSSDSIKQTGVSPVMIGEDENEWFRGMI